MPEILYLGVTEFAKACPLVQVVVVVIVLFYIIQNVYANFTDYTFTWEIFLFM